MHQYEYKNKIRFYYCTKCKKRFPENKVEIRDESFDWEMGNQSGIEHFNSFFCLKCGSELDPLAE